LGVDPLSCKKKACSFNCVYCQLGRAGKLTSKKKLFIKTKDIIDEIKSLKKIKADYITFSGMGEPTLASNLAGLIREIKKIRHEKIAILTNATTLRSKKIRNSLGLVDFVIAKLDAGCEKTFVKINNPVRGINFRSVLTGIKKFKKSYKGKLALQIMFTKKNKFEAKAISDLVRDINPDEVQINTPLRLNRCKALSKNEIDKIKSNFKDMNVMSVYDKKKKKIFFLNKEKILKRRAEL